jgi:hypothetical protein
MMTIKGENVRLRNPKRDRCARYGDLEIGKKKAALPVISPMTITKNDFRIMYDFITKEPEESLHLRMCTIRIIDTDKTLRPMLDLAKRAKHQLTLEGEPADKYLEHFIQTVPIIIDPCTEYTWYERFRKELATNRDIPIEIRKLAERIAGFEDQLENGKISKKEFNKHQTEEYENFWLGLLREEKLLADIVTRMLQIEHGLGADIGLPPVPVVYSPKMLEVTKLINRYAPHIWAGQNCAAYIILSPEFINSDAFVDQLIQYLEEIPNKFIVLKFKNLELHKVSYIYPRKMYKRILDAIIKIKHKPKNEKVFILLEAGYQMYPSVAGGFDIVSTSLRGYDKDSKGGNPISEGLGGWFDPKYMVFRGINDVRLMLKDNNNTLKCSCQMCTTMKAINRKTWNLERRVHYMFALSRILSELWNYIDSERMELARFKLIDSALGNFKNTLPIISEE